MLQASKLARLAALLTVGCVVAMLTAAFLEGPTASPWGAASAGQTAATGTRASRGDGGATRRADDSDDSRPARFARAIVERAFDARASLEPLARAIASAEARGEAARTCLYLFERDAAVGLLRSG